MCKTGEGGRSVDEARRAHALDEWSEQHVDWRDALAHRRLMGERLPDDDASELDRLDTELQALLPRTKPLPARVLDAVAEVERVEAPR